MPRHPWTLLPAAIALAIAFLAPGCSPSLVYSPAAKLPSRPLLKEQGELMGSLAFLPETRPQMMDHPAALGGDLTLRYAFSNNLTLGVSAWADVSDQIDGVFRGGGGVEAIIPLDNANPTMTRFGLMPRLQLLLDGGSIEGWGLALPVTMWLPSSGAFTTFAAVGPIYGARSSTDADERNQWGYGLVGNLGTSIDISTYFRANLEVAGVIAVNRHDNITHGILAPSVGFAWKF